VTRSAGGGARRGSLAGALCPFLCATPELHHVTVADSVEALGDVMVKDITFSTEPTAMGATSP
jgi:hypothetical protein